MNSNKFTEKHVILYIGYFHFGGIALKALIRAIDKFCLTHRRFGIPRLMLYVVFGSAAIYLISKMDTTYTFLGLIEFDAGLILKGQVWRIISWVFFPNQGNILLMALMLYFYYFIGTTLEREWGTPKFTIYYIIGIVLNIVYGFIVWAITGRTPGLSSSYINLSMFFTFATLFPDMRVMLFFFIPVKIKWLALVDAVFFVYNIIFFSIAGLYFEALIPVVAVLNFFIFCADDLLSYLRPIRARNTRQAINFRKAAKQKRHEEASKPYRHKCAVCGKTDAEYPNLEFRYCSRCNGYHCFCAEHINSHVHFQ
jgi:hypothetical protein